MAHDGRTVQLLNELAHALEWIAHWICCEISATR